jgi:hypothetical protein
MPTQILGHSHGEWEVRGAAAGRDSLSLLHGYHERGAVAGCVPGATAVQRVAYVKNVAASHE